MNQIDTAQNGLIVFESKYGATKQYAEWIADELVLPLIKPASLSLQQLQSADFLVIGTPVYNGVFRIKNWLREHVKAVSGKRLFFFVVNATAEAEQAKRDQFVVNSIPPEIRQDCAVYFMPGRLIHHQLNFFDGLMLSVAAKLMTDPVKKKAIKADIDGVKKANIAALCNAVNEYCGLRNASAPVNREIQPVA
jgi:menaquinone-dependent protoporphyrinogen IX oxidase